MADAAGIFVYACTGPITESGQCPDGAVWLQYADITAFQISQLDPSTIASAFGAGFVIPATLFVVGRVTGAVLKSIGYKL